MAVIKFQPSGSISLSLEHRALSLPLSSYHLSRLCVFDIVDFLANQKYDELYYFLLGSGYFTDSK